MAFIESTKREFHLKIVYCGAACCGKQTNFVSLCNQLTQQTGEVVSLETKEDGMLCFDFVRTDPSFPSATMLPGFTTRFQLCAVPSQAENALREQALKGVDGIVFVIDSQGLGDKGKAFKSLQENLKKNDLSLDQIPYVLQYNKRDLPDVALISFLEEMFNNRANRTLAFEAVATMDIGTMETLNGVIRLVLAKSLKTPKAHGQGN